MVPGEARLPEGRERRGAPPHRVLAVLRLLPGPRQAALPGPPPPPAGEHGGYAFRPHSKESPSGSLHVKELEV